MKYNPLVSVVIPSYNSARFVCDAINSVLEQTYKKYEIIVVDDGSTDNTKKILEPYIRKKKIRYVYQENKKQAAARNKGIINSKGNLIAFLDADDMWIPNKLQLQVPLFKDKGVGLVYGDVVLLENDLIKPGIHTNEFVSGKIFKKLIMANFICASSVVIRRECIDKVGFFKEEIDYFGVEDYHMWLKISYYFKVDYVTNIIVKYRIHSNSTSENYSKIVEREVGVRKDIIKMFNLPRKISRDCLFNSYFRLSYYSIKNKIYGSAYKALLKAFLLKPFYYKNYKLLVKLILYKLVRS